MRRPLLLGLMIMLAGYVVGVSPAWAQKKVALLIGNSAYTSVAPLRNPGNDVALMARTLKDAGFDSVETAVDLDDRALRQALRTFEERALDADVGVVFYSGHGIEMSGQNYLIPVNAKLASDLDVEDEAVPLDRVLKALDGVRRLRLVILDACRDNPFLASMKRSVGSRSVGRGLGRVEPQSAGTLIAYAAKAGTTAADGTGSNSPFTTALARNLTKPGLDVRWALGSVRDEVMAATGQKQEPFVYGSLGGSTLTLGPTAAPPVAAVAPAPSVPPTAAAPANDPCLYAPTHWTQAEKIDRTEFYEEHLRLFATCPFAGFARLKIAEKQKVAAIPPLATPAEASQRTLSGGELIRSIQLELQRVGCEPGKIDGTWSKATRWALERFNTHAKASLDVKVASLGALDALRARDARACPLVCATGLRVSGDQCVPIACGAGKVLSAKGVCVDVPTAAPQRPAVAQPAAPASPGTAGKAPGMYNEPQSGMNCSRFGPTVNIGAGSAPPPITYWCK